MIYYTTEWEQGKKKGIYKTKSHTAYHNKIHELCEYALTLRIDTSVNWAFGLFTEIVKKTNKKLKK